MLLQWIPYICFFNSTNKQLKIFANHKWKIKWCLMCLFLLSDFNVAQNTEKPSIQRRFMWKHMDNTMDGIISSVNTGTQAVKNMIGEFLPLMQTTPSTNEYATSTTTRIKYIIKKPTPMKIIKIRSPMKLTKILTMPTTISTTSAAIPRNNIHKLNEIYAESLINNQINKSALKSSAMSKLHTNIMQDDRADDHIEDDDIAMDSSLHVNKFYKKPNRHTYEVVENIEENETNAFQGLSYTTSKKPLTATTTATNNGIIFKTTESPIITTTSTNIGRHKKLRDQKLLTTPVTFSITEESWQPSLGFQTSTKPHVVWQHEKWPSIVDSVSEEPAVIREKPKRRKNQHQTYKRLKLQEKRVEEQVQPQHTTTQNKQKRGSVKFGDRINSK